MADTPAPTGLVRRDLIVLSKLLKQPISQLFPGGAETPEAALGLSYLAEKKAGETDLEFDAWLDQPLMDDDAAAGDEADPT
ncbi:MAG: hypothetical protein M3O70_08905 [Actinomycetota bacterium]|nr:hypothetical protein [Actinomycetota bacterium]